MKQFLFLGALVLFGTIASPAIAGIADSPLPVLLAGNSTFHLYSVPGVRSSLGLGTYFDCTSTNTAPVQIGVEISYDTGGPPANDAAATSVSVAAGQTVTFGTRTPVGLDINVDLGVALLGTGSARIVATAKNLVCTAFVADYFNLPLLTTWQLTIVKKTKQKGD